MKDQSERWIILPFSFGCSSNSSVAVGSPSPLNDAAQTSMNSDLFLHKWIHIFVYVVD